MTAGSSILNRFLTDTMIILEKQDSIGSGPQKKGVKILPSGEASITPSFKNKSEREDGL